MIAHLRPLDRGAGTGKKHHLEREEWFWERNFSISRINRLVEGRGGAKAARGLKPAVTGRTAVSPAVRPRHAFDFLSVRVPFDGTLTIPVARWPSR